MLLICDKSSHSSPQRTQHQSSKNTTPVPGGPTRLWSYTESPPLSPEYELNDHFVTFVLDNVSDISQLARSSQTSLKNNFTTILCVCFQIVLYFAYFNRIEEARCSSMVEHLLMVHLGCWTNSHGGVERDVPPW